MKPAEVEAKQRHLERASEIVRARKAEGRLLYCEKCHKILESRPWIFEPICEQILCSKCAEGPG